MRISTFVCLHPGLKLVHAAHHGADEAKKQLALLLKTEEGALAEPAVFPLT